MAWVHRVLARVPRWKHANQQSAAHCFTNKKVRLADDAESFCRSVHKWIFRSFRDVRIGREQFLVERCERTLMSMSSMGLFAPIGEVDMKSAPGPVRVSRTDRRSDRSCP